jgi:RNA polymerase sigma-70 factor, ECF subfamily
MRVMDDDELIASLARGDDTALRQLLFDRHAPWLAARLRRALPSDDVEDVLQETFLAVWKNARTYQPRGAAEGWLWVIARNQAALLLRRRGRPTAPLPDEAAGPGRGQTEDPAEAALTRLDAARTATTPGLRRRRGPIPATAGRRGRRGCAPAGPGPAGGPGRQGRRRPCRRW